MKKKIFYVCEECGLKYEDKEGALKCENGHPKKLKITTNGGLGIVKIECQTKH